MYRDLILEFYRANYFHQKGHRSEARAQPSLRGINPVSSKIAALHGCFLRRAAARRMSA